MCQEINDSKICEACNEDKPLNKFKYSKKRDKYDCVCRKCRNEHKPNLKPKILTCKAHLENGIMVKRCCGCKETKETLYFSKNCRNPDGYQQYCIDCRRTKNPKQTKPYEENGKMVKECMICHRTKELINFTKSSRAKCGITSRCKVCTNEYLLEYNNKNREKRNKVYKKSYKKHSKKISEKSKDKYENNPHYRIMVNTRTLINKALKGNIKSDHTEQLIGVTIEEYKLYLESLWTENMSWKTHKKKGWGVDHITPCEVFLLDRPEHQRACFDWKNTRPMWHTKNSSKNDRLLDGRLARNLSDEEKIEYLKNNGFAYLFN